MKFINWEWKGNFNDVDKKDVFHKLRYCETSIISTY